MTEEKELIEVAVEFSQMYGKIYKAKYGLRDLTGELFIHAHSRLKVWTVPQDTIGNIKKAWGKYLSLAFRDVLHRNLKDGVIKKYTKNGECFKPIVNFSDGVPDIFSSPEKKQSNAKTLICKLRRILTPTELNIIRLRTDLFYGKRMTLDEIADHLGCSKTKISVSLKRAREKSMKYLYEIDYL